MSKKALTRMLAHLMDDPGDLTGVADRFKAVVAKQATQPFPYREFGALLQECPDAAKLRMAQACRLHLRASSGQPFPDQRFTQLLRPRMIDPGERTRLLRALLPEILPLYGEEETWEPVEHLAEEQRLSETYGPWHYYWSLRLYPAVDEQIAQRMTELAAELREQTVQAGRTSQTSQTTHPEQERQTQQGQGRQNGQAQEQQTKQVATEREREMARLEGLVRTERERRRELELERDAMASRIAKLERECERLQRLRSELEQEASAQEEALRELRQSHGSERQRADAAERERRALELRLAQAEQRINRLTADAAEQGQRTEELEQQLRTERIRSEGRARALREQTDRQQADREPPEQQVLRELDRVVDRLYGELRTVGVRARQEALRSRLSDALLLANALERFFDPGADTVDDGAAEGAAREAAVAVEQMGAETDGGPRGPSASATPGQSGSGTPGQSASATPGQSGAVRLGQSVSGTPRQSVSATPGQSASAATGLSRSAMADLSAAAARSEAERGGGIERQDEAEADRGVAGTFYRRDHGGYIVLESEEAFNITESMVTKIGLEHEAEVACRPHMREDGSMGHHITILLQGDDAYAPIRQYMGYVELGSHHNLYCVDLNDPQHRYPIHDKDVEIQQPQDGDPCSFNVAIGGEYARLSRLYKRAERLPTDDSQETRRSKAAARERSTRRTAEPFLEGCRVVVIGGMSKWFESVVRETGAELVHDSGETPERIHAQLRRAHALFLLLTNNSHNATWSCIEIAKAHDIPHFRIEGSKSNLRQQLWDNRALIRAVAEASGGGAREHGDVG